MKKENEDKIRTSPEHLAEIIIKFAKYCWAIGLVPFRITDLKRRLNAHKISEYSYQNGLRSEVDRLIFSDNGYSLDDITPEGRQVAKIDPMVIDPARYDRGDNPEGYASGYAKRLWRPGGVRHGGFGHRSPGSEK